MRALLFSFVLLIAGAWLFGQQDEEVRFLIFGLLFGAMVGGMCAYTRGYYHGQAAEQQAQAQRHDRHHVERGQTVKA